MRRFNQDWLSETESWWENCSKAAEFTRAVPFETELQQTAAVPKEPQPTSSLI